MVGFAAALVLLAGCSRPDAAVVLSEADEVAVRAEHGGDRAARVRALAEEACVIHEGSAVFDMIFCLTVLGTELSEENQ